VFIAHDAAQLYTVEFGSGPRTILAHGGWTGSWELWAGPFNLLSKSWRTIAYDHRGTGATLAPVASISIKNMVADVFAVMDKMDIETCILAAESAGAMVAVTAALEGPQRFEGLVLVDPLLHNKDEGSDTAFINGLKTNFAEIVTRFADACVPEGEPNSIEIRNWGRKILARASPESAVRLLECIHGVDLRPQLARLQLPTLILHGDLDTIVPLTDSEYIASQISNSCLHVIKGAGHVPTMTRPHEVAQEIHQYFSKQ
jgi:pimeloyl-ACP methyl ester carboxylesterase